eukprot:XP_013987011.1 PREDICTED: solute carrier family 22 member 7-like isoform X2 [Salmo salar]
MRFEEVLDEVGGFSKFQFLVLHLLCLPRVILPLHFLLHNFISGVPPHHCALGIPGDGSQTLADPMTLALRVPREADGSFSSCRAFATLVTLDLGHSNYTNVSMSVPCQDGWVYDRSQFTSTTATQWDLVCDNKKLNQAVATFFFVGVTIGAVIFGYLSDKFGRKPMILVSFVASAVFGTMSAFSVSYVMFAVTRTLCGVALTGMTITTLALSIEWTDIKHRTFTGTIISLGWSVGNMLLALLAYFIRDWRYLMLVVTSPCIVAIISWWWIPESARWLLANGKVKEAKKYLVQCAKMNGKYGYTAKLDIETLRKVTVSEVANKDYSYLDLVKTPKLRKITICSGIFCPSQSGHLLRLGSHWPKKWPGVVSHHHGSADSSQYRYPHRKCPGSHLHSCGGEGFLRSCFHYSFSLHSGALSHRSQTVWFRLHLIHGANGRLTGPDGHAAGELLGVHAPTYLRRHRHWQRLCGLPAARDPECVSSGKHPRRRGKA